MANMYQAPNEYAVEQADIERRRRYAEALQQQGMAPLGPTETVGGMAIYRSPVEGLAKAVQGYMGAKGIREADERSKALGSKYQMDLANVLRQAEDARTGTPANSDILKSNQGLDSFDPQEARAPNTAAIPGIYMRHPATQAMGMAQVAKQADMQMLTQALRGGQPQGSAQGTGSPAEGAAPLGSGLPPIELLGAGDMGKTLFNAIQQQNKPIPVSEGGSVYQPGVGAVFTRPKLGENVLPTTDARGNVTGVVPMPGATGVLQGVKEAEEAAKAKFDLVSVPDGKGGTRMMPRSEAVKMLGPVPANRGVVDTEAQALEKLRQGPGSFEVRNPDVPSGQTLPKPVLDAQSEKGQLDAKRVQLLEEKIPSLNATNRRLDRLMELNTDDKTYAAAGAELKTTLSSVAQAFGLPVQIKKTANSEEYIAHIAELMKERLASKDYGSGTGVSNLDLLAAGRPLPELTRTREGRKQVLDALKLDVKRATDDSMAARGYFEKNSSLKGFKFPSEDAGSQPPYGAGNLSQQEQQELDALRGRFGRK